MKETVIVVLDADYFDRSLAEELEDQSFKTSRELVEQVERINPDCDVMRLEFYSLTEFMNMCNDDDINTFNSWISYVTIENYE